MSEGISSLCITEVEEGRGLRRLFDLQVELPIPEKMTRPVAGYIGRLEAENAALKSTIASLLSIDDSKVAEYVVLDAEALKQAAGNRVAELEAQVARLEAPVSDAECAKYEDDYELAEGDDRHGWIRTCVANLIASRSTPPAKEASNATA